jgi:hypothetical protein
LLADAAALKNSESLLCTIYSVLFISALINFPGWFTLIVLPGYLEALEHLCLIALINLHSCHHSGVISRLFSLCARRFLV